MLSPWRATGNDGEKLADALERLTTVLVEHLAELIKELLAQAPPVSSRDPAATWTASLRFASQACVRNAHAAANRRLSGRWLFREVHAGLCVSQMTRERPRRHHQTH